MLRYYDRCQWWFNSKKNALSFSQTRSNFKIRNKSIGKIKGSVVSSQSLLLRYA